MAESQAELKRLLIKVKEEGEKPGLKLNMADSCWGLTEKKKQNSVKQIYFILKINLIFKKCYNVFQTLKNKKKGNLNIRKTKIVASRHLITT